MICYGRHCRKLRAGRRVLCGNHQASTLLIEHRGGDCVVSGRCMVCEGARCFLLGLVVQNARTLASCASKPRFHRFLPVGNVQNGIFRSESSLVSRSASPASRLTKLVPTNREEKKMFQQATGFLFIVNPKATLQAMRLL